MTRLAVGDAAPPFTLPDAEGVTRSLSDYAGRRFLLYAYPAAGTPGCTKQACDFRDSLDAFTGLGVEVIGISPDTPAALAQFRQAQRLPFPLLSDPDSRVLAAYGAYGEKSLYGRTVVGVIRSTFLIGADGRIELARYAVKATGHVARLLREFA